MGLFTRSRNDAIRILEEDHDRIEGMLAQIADTGSRAEVTRRRLFLRVRDALRLHEAMEERVLYPALRKFAKERDIVLEGLQEHHVVDVLLAELARMDPATDGWQAKAHVMQENIEHHVKEEEHKLFPLARRLVGTEALEKLGAAMLRIRAGGPQKKTLAASGTGRAAPTSAKRRSHA